MSTSKHYVVLLIFAMILAACGERQTGITPVPTEATVATVPEPTPTPPPEPTDTPEREREPDEGATETDGPESPTATVMQISAQFPLAEIVNEEGGPVKLTGDVSYTDPLFTSGTAEPLVILEDQSGFVERNEFFLMPPDSQTLGQITSDFFTSPFSYSLALPIEPQGTLNDVDNDGEDDLGVQIFAVAYWTNTFGDPFLEARDLSGGGWSTAYASTLVSDDAATKREIVGGKFLIYAPDDQQGFPSGFGDDGLLFTEDDPIVAIPQGYSVVDLDAEPFVFDRAREQVVDLIEPEAAALVDFSELDYPQAFDSLVEHLSKNYAFTDYKGIDWEALHDEFRPRFEDAEAAEDVMEYRRALRDFSWSIPDGHVSVPLIVEDFRTATAGGLGIAIRETDDGRSIVNFLLESSPADGVGIELGAEILTVDGVDIGEAISETVTYSAPFSTPHFERLQQERYVTRYPLGSEVNLAFRNPGSAAINNATMTAVPEPESFSFSSFNAGRDGFEQPVAYELMGDSGLGYVKIYSFFDNELLTIQLWERLMRNLNQNGVPGLIIDMRQNGGGNLFLAEQMAAYFFDEPLVLGNHGRYDEELDDFFFDSRSEERFYLPAEDLRYDGEVAVIAGPNCASACEFFSYDMTLQDRAAIVGQYPTAGLGGSIDQVLMPEGQLFTYTHGRAVDVDGNIHIEGIGVAPTVRVPVNEETLLTDGDPVLEAAVAHVQDALVADVVEGRDVALGETVSGTLESGFRVRHRLALTEGDVVTIFLASDDFEPLLAVYSEAGELLGIVEGGAEPVVEELEIETDLVLVLEVLASEEDEGGDYTLRMVNSGD